MPTLRSKNFKPNDSAEKRFAKALKQVARQAGHMVELHVRGAEIVNESEMLKSLVDYSKKLEPWARRQAAKMLEQVAKKNKTAWKKGSKIIYQSLQTSVSKADVGTHAALLMREQVDLIQSIPLRAAERAHKLSMEAFYNGTRADQVAEELMRSTEVSESDAVRIARTEVARSNSVITQARAQSAGSKQYVWRTSGDASVRPSHKEMNGEVINWDKPPTLSDGMIGHAGTFPNCRCYPEPFFPEE